MQSHEFNAFVREFLRVSSALERRPQSIEQATERARAYFDVLRSQSLEQVIARADGWLDRQTKFPTPAEWKFSAARAVELLPFSDRVVAQYHRAKALRWEDEPCRCNRCREAGVTHRLLRFVPETNGDAPENYRVLGGEKVYRGHWAHGFELRRWYDARDGYRGMVNHLGPGARKFAALVGGEA